MNTKLFESPSQIREVRAIKRIFDTMYYWSLCNDLFSWFAVNIPLDLVNDEFTGDIDILVKIPQTPVLNHTEFYRAFEVKTTIVNINNITKSVKLNKINKTKKQLEKLIQFGAEQIWYLDLYILEDGYDDKNSFYNPIIEQILKSKGEELHEIGAGYLVMPLEFIPGIEENTGGIYYEPLNLIKAKQFKAEEPFVSLTKFLNNFFEINRPSVGIPIITYCKKCKALKMIGYSREPNTLCSSCSQDLFMK